MFDSHSQLLVLFSIVFCGGSPGFFHSPTLESPQNVTFFPLYGIKPKLVPESGINQPKYGPPHPKGSSFFPSQTRSRFPHRRSGFRFPLAGCTCRRQRRSASTGCCWRWKAGQRGSWAVVLGGDAEGNNPAAKGDPIPRRRLPRSFMSECAVQPSKCPNPHTQDPRPRQ